MARVPDRVRTLVIARDKHACVRCSQPVKVPHLQHRCARGMGGSRSQWHNSPAYLITLCHRCHLYWVERHRLDAQLHGWTIRHGIIDPATTACHWHGEWVLLGHDGSVSPASNDPPAHDPGGR